MNNDYLKLAKEKMDKAITSLEERFMGVRAGRANPSMLDDVFLDYYGTKTQLKLGVTPNNNGESIFITIPPLTEERRKELVKQVKEYAEEGRISIRNIRKDIIDIIKKDDLPEDEERNLIEELQEIVNEYNKKVEDLTKEKEKDLMEI